MYKAMQYKTGSDVKVYKMLFTINSLVFTWTSH